MAGLDPATQRARLCGRKRIIGSRTLACWMAGSEAGHGERFDSRHSKTVLIAGFAFALCASAPANAAEADAIRTAGEILRIALPVAAAGISLGKDDRHGFVQLAGSEVLAEGSSLLLQELIEEERPDKSDRYSFPSDSAAVAFSAASFLQIRYGWGYGLPAYAVAGFVGWSRVESQRHYWHDVIAGAALGWVASEITAMRYHDVPGPIGASVPVPAAFAHGPLGFSFAAHW